MLGIAFRLKRNILIRYRGPDIQIIGQATVQVKIQGRVDKYILVIPKGYTPANGSAFIDSIRSENLFSPQQWAGGLYCIGNYDRTISYFNVSGIFLIKSLSDDVKYNGNGNEVEIGFKISSINFETAVDRLSKFKEYTQTSHNVNE